MESTTESIARAATQLRRAAHAFALTGAGISVESGIPDFRSAAGLWAKYPPDEFATIDAFRANPDKVWRMWRALGESLLEAAPNPGHFALARLEAAGRIRAVVTQNIDNLHQRAGSARVIEYHGNGGRTCCLACHRRAPLQAAALGDAAPRCGCGGLLKPDVVLFGELIPTHALFEAEAFAQKADVVLIVGTSAQVYPAAGLPYTAKKRGAFIVECNIEPTDFTREITDVFLQGPAGTVLPQLTDAVTAG